MSGEKRPREVVGEKVTEGMIDEREVTYQWWEPEVQYAWSCGPAMSRFLEELKKGNLIARTCKKCDRVIFPPRMFCEHCHRPTDEWIYVEDTGSIVTYSISYLDPDARPIEEPILIGVIDIDGASEGHGFMHYFDEVDPEDLEIGMRVKAVWRPEEDRMGSITDIKYFKPLEE